ncbi:hypothetical protein ACRAWF_01690 [Streptomyces sp. L7]
MNRLTARAGAVAVVAGVALTFAAALPAQAADSTVTEAEWLSDVAAVTGPAQTYIDSRAAANTSGAKQAIVLDIDNTSLETYFEGVHHRPRHPAGAGPRPGRARQGHQRVLRQRPQQPLQRGHQGQPDIGRLHPRRPLRPVRSHSS